MITIQNQQDSSSLRDRDWHNGLTKILTMCFDSLKVYGKTYEQMGSLTKMFKMMLRPYNMEEIEGAFVRHLTVSNEMPTPKDIIAIIDPSTQPKKWSHDAFRDIKRRIRENQFVPDDEIKYCDDYIKAQLNEGENENR